MDISFEEEGLVFFYIFSLEGVGSRWSFWSEVLVMGFELFGVVGDLLLLGVKGVGIWEGSRMGV